MRILYFSRSYTTHDRRFLQAICESPHEVFFLRLESDQVLYEPRPLPEKVEEVAWDHGRGGVDDPADLLKLMPAFEAAVKRLRPSMIHAGPVGTCGFMAAMLRFHPFLLMSWGSDVLVDARRDALHRWLASYALSAADRFFCDSETVLREAAKLTPIGRERVLLFPWGVDVDLFRPGVDDSTIRERFGWQKRKVVLTTRAWEPTYRTELLLEAFLIAYKKDADLRLLMLSTGSLRPYVEQFICENHLQDVIHRPGQVLETELPAYLRAADAYVSAAAADGSSISLLQAMAVGVPPVVTDNPSNREWIDPEENGWLAEGTASAFASAIGAAVNLSAERRAEMVSRNVALVEQRAHWRRNVGILLKTYEDLAPS
jgi:L-malate glycosyltransferase